jgi:hypothetical protein
MLDIHGELNENELSKQADFLLQKLAKDIGER